MRVNHNAFTVSMSIKRFKISLVRLWHSRPHPYYFNRRYSDGAHALHIGPLEIYRKAQS